MKIEKLTDKQIEQMADRFIREMDNACPSPAVRDERSRSDRERLIDARQVNYDLEKRIEALHEEVQHGIDRRILLFLALCASVALNCIVVAVLFFG